MPPMAAPRRSRSRDGAPPLAAVAEPPRLVALAQRPGLDRRNLAARLAFHEIPALLARRLMELASSLGGRPDPSALSQALDATRCGFNRST